MRSLGTLVVSSRTARLKNNLFDTLMLLALFSRLLGSLVSTMNTPRRDQWSLRPHSAGLDDRGGQTQVLFDMNLHHGEVPSALQTPCDAGRVVAKFLSYLHPHTKSNQHCSLRSSVDMVLFWGIHDYLWPFLWRRLPRSEMDCRRMDYPFLPANLLEYEEKSF